MHEELLFLGLPMTLGLADGSAAELVRLPRVAAYVLVGTLLSEPLLGGLAPSDPGCWVDAVSGVALGGDRLPGRLAGPNLAGSGTATLRLNELQACPSCEAAPPVTCAGALLAAGALS